ncbi:MAG: hypothetical protein WDN25_16600 [Acetobacteraceae bacterium]
MWLLVEDTSTDTVARLREYGVIVERAARSAQPGMAAMSSRYFSYLDVLSRAGDGYDHVLLADPATTVFQADPFAAPLPADIVFTSEGRHIGDTPAVYEAVVRAYGEAVAHNIRHCVVAESGTTIATRSGMLRYLAAMTRQFGGRTTPITGAFDLGVHNYVVHMHRLRDAWLDPANRIVATLHAVPDEALAITDDAVLVGGAATPVLTRCDANARMVQQLRTAPRFRPDEPVPIVAAPGPRDAVVAYYHRERDEGWLHLFFGSLRGIGETIAAHCIGDFNEAELAILRRYGCVPHVVPPSDLGIAENVAHFYISQALDGMEAEAVPLGQVLVLDSVRALFLRDPFLTGMTGLSVFAEGPTRIGDSDYNRDRLGFFVQPIEPLLENPVVSSMAMRGELPVLRAFYRRMFNELVAPRRVAADPQGGAGRGQQDLPRRRPGISGDRPSERVRGVFRVPRARTGSGHAAWHPVRRRRSRSGAERPSGNAADDQAADRPRSGRRLRRPGDRCHLQFADCPCVQG